MRWLVAILVMAGVINPMCACGELSSVDSHLASPASHCESEEDHTEPCGDHEHSSTHTQPRSVAQAATPLPTIPCHDLMADGDFLTAVPTPTLLDTLEVSAHLDEMDDPRSAWPPLRRHCALLL